MKYFFTVISIFLLKFVIFPQDSVVLIAHDNFLVGGTQNGRWLKDSELSKSFGKPEKFIGFDSFRNSKPSEMYGTLGELGCGTDYYYFSQSAKIPESIFDETSLKPVLAISANAKWDPLPRAPKKLNRASKFYQKIVLAFLRTKGMRIKNVKIENAFSIDLEGDGTNEIFLEATNYKDKNGEIRSTARAGNYSFVLMRKVINGKAKNFLIEGEFHPRKPEVESYVTEFGLSAFADLNGDGKIEVILENLYSYGGSSSEIYESDENGLKNVLSAECGD